MPVSSAICDIVTDSSPRLATSAAAVSNVASRTSRRCVSIVSVQSFGITELYATAVSRRYALISTYCLVNYWRGEGVNGPRIPAERLPGRGSRHSGAGCVFWSCRVAAGLLHGAGRAGSGGSYQPALPGTPPSHPRSCVRLSPRNGRRRDARPAPWAIEERRQPGNGPDPLRRAGADACRDKYVGSLNSLGGHRRVHVPRRNASPRWAWFLS